MLLNIWMNPVFLLSDFRNFLEVDCDHGEIQCTCRILEKKLKLFLRHLEINVIGYSSLITHITTDDDIHFVPLLLHI